MKKYQFEKSFQSESDSFDSTGSETQSIEGSEYNVPPDAIDDDQLNHKSPPLNSPENYLAPANDEH